MGVRKEKIAPHIVSLFAIISMREIYSKTFANGSVYALETLDRYPVEVTDTFLPYYTKHSIGNHQNQLCSTELGSRDERWMIGVSCMSGCPCGCKFCATGQLKKYRNLSAEEIVEQVLFVVNKNKARSPSNSKEFKINYTRMGEPFLNIQAVKKAIEIIDAKFKNVHHYISTIGIAGSDFSWIKDNITLQISLHSLDEAKRDWLIPFYNKMSIQELGMIRTQSNLLTTINMTLVDQTDFDIEKLQKYFSREFFFVKLSPINPNKTSEVNHVGNGVIMATNLV